MNENELKYVEKFVENITEFIRDIFQSEGELRPMLWILIDTGVKDPSVITWPIPPSGVASDDAKEIIAISMVKFLAHLNSVGIRPICTLFTSEAWVRKIDPELVKDGKFPNNWKDFPKVDSLMLTFETIDKTCTLTFEIETKGKKRILSDKDMFGTRELIELREEQKQTKFSYLISRALEYEL